VNEIYTALLKNASVFLGSAVVAAMVSAWVSLRNSARVVRAQYITAERAKWRDRVRCVALEINKSAIARDRDRLAELSVELTLFLNPIDPMDAEIVDLVRNLRDSHTPRALGQEILERVALLLKHDWERAKREAQPLPRWICGRSKRMSYKDFRNVECRRKTHHQN
jgi:hypothetical protein